MKQPVSYRGFTIVELLIVIVVIGILAAITIVAYSGIQARAQAAALSSALNQTNQKLALYLVDNGAYPADLNTVGITNAGSTSYQYSVNNLVSPPTYCVTATIGTTSYHASSMANAPVSGGCTVTNFVANPSAEANGIGLSADTGLPTISRSTAQSNRGLASFMLTSTAVSPDVAVWMPVMLTPGTYTLSYYVYSPDARLGLFDWYDTTGLVGNNTIGSQAIAANTWTRIVGTVTFAGSGSHEVHFYLHNRSGPNVSGATIYIDSLMVTQTSSAPNYADGNSPGWAWSGTINNSTSTGPAL